MEYRFGSGRASDIFQASIFPFEMAPSQLKKLGFIGGQITTSLRPSAESA